MRGQLLTGCLLLILALEASAQRLSTTPGYTESEIKAAFTLHLISFISWPNSQQPNVLCVVDESGVHDALELLLNKREAKDISLRSLVDTRDVGPCDLLFLGSDVDLPAFDHTLPVLTIGERTGFAAAGGMVELSRRAGRVELIINESELQHAGFSASSRLMSLATIVTPGVVRP